MQKILITGGCGFIGSNLIDYLLRHQLAEVRVLDNQSLGKFEYISDLDVEFMEGDIRNQSDIKKALLGVDAVVHLAADTRVIDSIQNPSHNFENNVIGTFNLLEVARNLEINSIVTASTGGAILGEVTPPVHEEMLPHPIAPYGASKLAAEAYCSAFAGSYGMNLSALRFTNVYGPRSYHKGSVVAHFFKQIKAGKNLIVYGDGTQLRDYIYVDDLCEGIWKCLTLSTPLKGEVIQLGTAIPTSINQLIEKIRNTVGTNYPFSVEYQGFRQGELKNTYADISKASKILNFSPATNLDTGLSKTWEWFLKQMG